LNFGLWVANKKMLGTTEIIIIVIVVLILLFGGKKILEIARSLGKVKGEFKKGKAEAEKESKEETDKEQK